MSRTRTKNKKYGRKTNHKRIYKNQKITRKKSKLFRKKKGGDFFENVKKYALKHDGKTLKHPKRSDTIPFPKIDNLDKSRISNLDPPKGARPEKRGFRIVYLQSVYDRLRLSEIGKLTNEELDKIVSKDLKGHK